MKNYLVIKSSWGHLEIRTDSNNNSLLITGKTPKQNVDKAILLDDPDLKEKLQDLWDGADTEIHRFIDMILLNFEKSFDDFIEENTN